MIDVDNTEEFRCLSLCTGYGGLELGLRRVFGKRMRTVAYVEVEAFAVANLVTKIEAGLLDAAPVWTDIKTFDAKPFYKKIHIVTAGYPCQPFSCAGRQKGKEDERYLWPDIERVLQAVRPVWFFGENVSGHLTIGFPDVYRSLQNLGYKVEAGLFSAAECGAPHRRCRLFILAHDTSCRFKTGKGKQARQSTPGNISSELADTPIQRIQRDEPEGFTVTKGQIEQCSWPARPGQQQYEWEEPRTTVGNTGARRLSGKSRRRPDVKFADRCSGQIESKLGRTIDGTSCRLDRLRLLGNGVVPQQAAKAFRELRRIEDL